MIDRKTDIIRANIKIIGFGNIYMSDDGIGIHVIKELEKLQYFEDFELIDGGTSGIDLIFHLQNSNKVILIDAVDAGQDIGEIILINPDDVKEFITGKGKSYSLHSFDLSEVLKLTKKLGLNKKLTIIGVKPENIGFGQSLSPVIKKKIHHIIAVIKKEIGSWHQEKK